MNLVVYVGAESELDGAGKKGEEALEHVELLVQSSGDGRSLVGLEQEQLHRRACYTNATKMPPYVAKAKSTR